MASQQNKTTLTIEFQDPDLLKEQSIIDSLRKKNADGEYVSAVVYDEIDVDGKITPVVHIGNPYDDDMIYTTVPTFATKQDIEDITSKVSWMKETCELVGLIAKVYNTRQILFVEGPTSIGKTFCFKVFSRCIYGANFEPQEMTCNEGTSPEQILGGWVPDTTQSDTTDSLNKILKTKYGKKSAAELAKIAEDTSDLDPETRTAILEQKGGEFLKAINGGNNKARYRYQPGIIERGYQGAVMPDGSVVVDPKKPSDGVPILLDEITRTKSSVSNTLFGIRGNGRRPAKSIQLHDDNGRFIRSGKNTWIMLSMNPVDEEDFEGVYRIDPALARSGVFTAFYYLSVESYQLIAKDSLRFKRDGLPTPQIGKKAFEFYNSKELVNELATTLRSFHLEYREVMQRIQKTRSQKIPVTLDDMSTFALELFNNPVKKEGSIDIVKSIERAFEYAYLKKPGITPPVKTELEKTLKHILHSKDTQGVKNAKGKVVTRAEYIKSIFEEQALPEAAKIKSNRQKLAAAASEALAEEAIPESLRNIIGSINS